MSLIPLSHDVKRETDWGVQNAAKWPALANYI